MEIKTSEVFPSSGPFNRLHCAVGVYQNTVYIYGGECASSSRAYDDLYSYRADLNEWKKIIFFGKKENRPGKLIGAQFQAVRGGLYLFGGYIYDAADLPLWFLNPHLDPITFTKVRSFGSSQPGNMLHSSLIWLNHDDHDYLYLFGGFKPLLGGQDSFYRLQIDDNRWEKLPSGPSGRYKAGIGFYQSHILIVGGITCDDKGSDIWGYHIKLGTWLQWTKNIPRALNGFGFIKNEVFYIIGEAIKSKFIMIYGYDLVERKLHSFYHKLPELTGFSIVALGGEREYARTRVRSAPNLRCTRQSQRSNHVMPVELASNFINGSFTHAEGNNLGLINSESCGVSLNEVRNQLEDLSRAHYDAENKKIIFSNSSVGGSSPSQASSASPKVTHSPPFEETHFIYSPEPESYNMNHSISSNSRNDHRGASFRSCKSSDENEKGEIVSNTPIQFYSPFNVEQVLMVIGGKLKKPSFKRDIIKLHKIDL